MKKTIWKTIVSVFIALLVAGVIFWTILNCSANRELEQEFTAIKNSGCPLSVKAFAPPPVPEEENAFMLYKKAFEMFDPGEGQEEVMWQEFLKSDNPVGWLPENRTAIESLLENNSGVFTLLEKAASCERSRIPFDYDKPIEKMGVVRMAHFINYLKLLSLKALLEIEKGKIDEAVQTCQVGLHFANILYSEPILVAQLIRIPWQKVMYETLETIFAQGEPSLPRCRALLEEITTYAGESRLARGFEAEMSLQIEMINQMLKGEFKLKASDTDMGARDRVILRLFTSRLARPIMKKDSVYYLRIWRDYVHCYKVPYREVEDAQAKWNKKYRFKKLPWCYIGSHKAASQMVFLAADRTECEAIAGNWQLALAIKIYREEEGKYPQSLDELCPVILKKLPKDPFSGREFLYRKGKDGFTVYSVGANLQDNAGEEDDIVWRCEK